MRFSVEQEVSRGTAEDRPSLGLFGLLRKDSAYGKQASEQAKTKTKHKVTFNLQKNQTRKASRDPDGKCYKYLFLPLCEKFQVMIFISIFKSCPFCPLCQCVNLGLEETVFLFLTQMCLDEFKMGQNHRQI